MDYFTARILPMLASRAIHKGHVPRDQYWVVLQQADVVFLLSSTSSLMWPGEFLCAWNSEPIQMVLDIWVMYDWVHAHYSGQHLSSW